MSLTPVCRALGKDGLCTVYDDRPQACRKYPFYVHGENVVIGPCPPVEAGLLDEHLENMRRAGYKII